MKIMHALLACFLFVSVSWAQNNASLPNAPTPIIEPVLLKPYAVNINISEKYGFLKDQFQTIPSITIDRRFFDGRARAGITYSYNVTTGENSITGGLNYKLLWWGKVESKKITH